ncbi:GIG1(induced by GlcNAc in Ca), DUF3605 superfamily domain-containing protein [Histoplasma capsulatum]|uniref:GIG1(Induced by GlcNAc in Ca), DUF3605 superfamily domain-containing protein n=1 Tax=Ajellomyces capsulatus TaxID=5037 RepID=A0A8A1MAM5_AJECA|nr:conserved hypothetical protein [Histoplasma mississippiense (nom. inval.)]EDN07333.1 conserved hypothetical protein [Histoplasma mississippiense (nom. inval.)]QSS61227.1 GIG1(induced by GlcNAc in Ca), DUF3605 superfamily domain-containing protein [Histoplasma capsulatum]
MGDIPPQSLNPTSAPFNLTDVDRNVLSQTDDEFVYHDWADLKSIIAANNLEVLRRKPSDLRRYIAWTTDIKAQYGSITNYIYPSDYKILRNDWPYGVTSDITHLVIWLKNSIPVREDSGDMTEESRTLINDFVMRTFVARLEKLFRDAKDRVLWFKNWTSLQSVRAVEHVHVVVRDAPDEIITEWTGEHART